jgi:hypothetical protein
MSVATLERAVLAGAKIILNNPKLKMRDIMEWSTGDIEPHEGEIVVRVPDPGVNVAVKNDCDKRKPRPSLKGV